MNDIPRIAVLCGGRSSEREVSLVSGGAVFDALKGSKNAVFYALDADVLPDGLNPESDVVFPVFHGGWGEGGGVQRLLDEGGFEYAGCGADSCARCMDKAQTKAFAALSGIPVLDEIVFDAATKPAPADVCARLGDDLVLKPLAEGSSVGLRMAQGVSDFAAALEGVKTGAWIVEPRVHGREFAIGVLGGRALGIVEIAPKNGVYDFSHKYTAGSTEYIFPAALPAGKTERMRFAAEAAFVACLCRDFARVDFLMDADGAFYLMEINTIPGLTPTSLMPKSASCFDMDFKALVGAMLAPAVARWRARRENR